MRPPLAWELELMEGILRAVPDFVSRHEQDDPTPEEFTVPVSSGPLKLGIRLPVGVNGRSVRLLVAGKGITPVLSSGWARVVIPTVLDHEVLVIE